ncbi:MAG TPA: YqgE/AlgH family protein [Bryobacteraceae bacterium]|jgi:putative transcriptional regulator
MMLKAFMVALLAFASLSAAWADDDLAPGKILVADRKLKDPNFERSVIYLITYDEKGAVGLILNRQTDTPVGKILSGVKGGAGRKDFAFSGGPVETDSILALYRGAPKGKGAQRVSAEISAILDETALADALAAPDGDRGALRFYLGYAGWGPGQLDAEIDAGGWYVIGGDAKMVFDDQPETLWDRLIRRKDQQVALSSPTRDLLTFISSLAHGTKLHPAHGIAGNVPAFRRFQLSL